MEGFISVKAHVKNNVFLVFMLALLSGCSTIGSDHTQPADRTLHPIDCTKNTKREECLAVANLDKKAQKKAVKPTQSDQRTRTTKIVENKKVNDEKAKVSSETPPAPPQNETAVSKPDEIPQKNFDAHASPFSVSMDCVRSNVKRKDDGRSNVRSVAYELAVMCTRKDVHVESIANASIPLVEQNRAPKKTK